MAKLWKRRDDNGCYIRGYIGAPITWQVHPHAIRYLNRRGVYVDDEIPPELMQKLKATKGWLFTKEEYPFVVFDEFKDPNFGTRPFVRGSVQGTTQVVSVAGMSGDFGGKSARKKPKKKSSGGVGTPATRSDSTAEKTPDWASQALLKEQPQSKQASNAHLMNTMPALAETSQDLLSESMMNASAPSSNSFFADADDHDGDSTTLTTRIKAWYVSGGDLPLWVVILIVILLLVASILMSRLF